MKNANFEWEHEPVHERRSLVIGTAPRQAASNGSDAWKLKRDPPQAIDFKLMPLAVVWASAIPVAIRPSELCLQYPRIANRLALVWQDVVLTQRVLESLAIDKRSGRKGFPKEVKDELIKLTVHIASTGASTLPKSVTR